jgi:FKBP-type peptidyl-prolyl cis-trans isomerase
MKRTLLALVALATLSSVLYAQAQPAPPQTMLEKVSYGIGLGLGRNLARDNVKLDLNWLVKGIQHGSDKTAKALLSDEDYQKTMIAFEEQLRKQQEDAAVAAAAKNKTAGEAFLAANGKKQGVVTTASGLQYQILKRGTGATPKANDEVSVHYHGTLIDGTVFDSSVQRGQPASFPVNRVIPGWTEALQLMKTGDKFRLFIPADLAYGESGSGDIIGPHATLIFDVDLLEILK